MFIDYNKTMKPEELLRYFGGDPKKAAASIGVSLGAIYQWQSAGEIPLMRQSDIEVRTAYKLKSDYTLQREREEGSDSGT